MDADQARMARAALKLSVRDVAEPSKSVPKYRDAVEAGLPVNHSTMSTIRYALEAAGVVFIAENRGGAGVRLRKIPPQESIPSDDLNASNDE